MAPCFREGECSRFAPQKVQRMCPKQFLNPLCGCPTNSRCPHIPHAAQAEREREALQRRFDDAVLAAQQRSAVRSAVLERRLEAASSELALAQQASTLVAAAPSGQALAAAGRSRATSAAHAGASAGQGSRRGSKVPGPADWVAAMLEAALHTPLPDGDADIIEDDAPRQILEQIAEMEAADDAGAGAGTAAAAVGVAAAWQGAAGQAEAEAPAAGQEGVDEAQGNSAQAKVASKAQLLVAEPSAEPLAALEAKLSQAALAATSAAMAAAAGAPGAEELRIAAHRGSQLG